MFEFRGIKTQINIHSCRVCLEIVYDDCVSFKQNNDLSQLFEFCIGISVSPEDVLQILCNKCIKIIREFANFKRQCHAADELWKSQLHQDTGDVQQRQRKKKGNGLYRNYQIDLTDALIKGVKKEENHEDLAVDATYLSQDENECDIQDDNIYDTYINKNEYQLKANACLKTEDKQLKRNPQKQQRNSNINGKYWRLDVNESDNESHDKEGLIKVLECSKCKKQYRKYIY
ncbi:unnamed protein product [Parnassius apollo]|uniref:(apollo) hypothetical protein n=1 Tax=Parnassius apollo TaxID=110799 RepID=A0A8S3WP31_PARAO|nr:unnamed protein product [Parnassius apollo]